jgi:hypothetical protein
MNPGFSAFRKQIIHPLRFRFFMLRSLPAAFFAGLRIISLDEHHAVIAVKHKWFNQNPFRSMYFAIQSMAAEMSTGLLAFGQVYKRNPGVSMLVVGLEATFIKKITGTVLFTCSDGEAISAAIEAAINSGEGVTVKCRSVGTNEAGETVAEFFLTWSFKVKRIK